LFLIKVYRINKSIVNKKRSKRTVSKLRAWIILDIKQNTSDVYTNVNIDSSSDRSILLQKIYFFYIIFHIIIKNIVRLRRIPINKDNSFLLFNIFILPSEEKYEFKTTKSTISSLGIYCERNV